jgi:hypothetical protein
MKILRGKKRPVSGIDFLDDAFVALEITIFVNFRTRPNASWAHANKKDGARRRHRPGGFEGISELFPTESDLLLSALEPFRGSTDVRLKVFDLSTISGRLVGLLNNVREAPAVIIAGERYVGLDAAQLVLSQLQEEVA